MFPALALHHHKVLRDKKNGILEGLFLWTQIFFGLARKTELSLSYVPSFQIAPPKGINAPLSYGPPDTPLFPDYT